MVLDHRCGNHRWPHWVETGPSRLSAPGSAVNLGNYSKAIQHLTRQRLTSSERRCVRGPHPTVAHQTVRAARRASRPGELHPGIADYVSRKSQRAGWIVDLWARAYSLKARRIYRWPRFRPVTDLPQMRRITDDQSRDQRCEADDEQESHRL